MEKMIIVNQLIMWSECVIFSCGVFLFMPNFVSLPVYTHAARLTLTFAFHTHMYSVLRRWHTCRNRFEAFSASSWWCPSMLACRLRQKRGRPLHRGELVDVAVGQRALDAHVQRRQSRDGVVEGGAVRQVGLRRRGGVAELQVCLAVNVGGLG